MDFIVSYKGSRRLQKDGDEHKFPRTQYLIQSVQRHKDAYNMPILQDWNTFRWSRVALLSAPAAKLIRMKVHVFSDSTLCVGVWNPDPSNNWIGQKNEELGERTWICRKMNFGSARSAIHSARTTRCCYPSNQDAYSETLERANSRIFRWEDHVHVHVLNDIEWTNIGASLGLRQKNMWWNGRYSERQGKYDIAALQMTCASGILPTRYFQRQPIFLGGKEEAITISKGTFDNNKQFALYVQTNMSVVWHWKSGTYTKNSGRRRANRSRTRAVDIDFP